MSETASAAVNQSGQAIAPATDSNASNYSGGLQTGPVVQNSWLWPDVSDLQAQGKELYGLQKTK